MLASEKTPKSNNSSMSSLSNSVSSINKRADSYLDAHLSELKSKVKIDDFRSGDLVKVEMKGEKAKSQKFEGRCIGTRGSGVSKTYKVWSVGAENGTLAIFPYYSHNVSVVRKGKVRRDKPNYLIQLRGKKARIKDRK